jgi:hypothetical protein
MCMRVRACTLAYPACNAYALYCDVICGISGSTTLLALFQNWHDFLKNVVDNKMCVLAFSTTFVQTFLILRRIWWGIVTYVKTSSYEVQLCLSDFDKIVIFSTDFRGKKSLNIKFHQNPSSESRVIPCGRTHGHDENNSRFSQFFEQA